MSRRRYVVDVKPGARMSITSDWQLGGERRGYEATVLFVDADGKRTHVAGTALYSSKQSAQRAGDDVASRYRTYFKTTGFRLEQVEAERAARKRCEDIAAQCGVGTANSIAKLPDDLREEAAHNAIKRVLAVVPALDLTRYTSQEN